MAEKENPQGLDALAGESHKGADDAAGLPVRLSRYSRAHHRALDMAKYARSQGDVKTAAKMEKCGHYLLFRDYYTVDKVRLHAADFCRKHLICPLCAVRRGAKLVKAYVDRFEYLRDQDATPVPYLVTVTVKNGDDLTERFRHLHSSMGRMSQARRSYLRGKGPHVEMAKALAGVASYEFKRGKRSGLWHPHCHAVWLCREAPDPEKLSHEWFGFTGDSYIVDVRPLDQVDPVSGFLEVFKYAVKFSDLPVADNWEGWKVLAGRRLVFSFGQFRGIDVPQDLNDEALDELPYVELLYQFVKGVGYSFSWSSPATDPDAAIQAASRKWRKVQTATLYPACSRRVSQAQAPPGA
ncbi:MAG: protein rep [Rhodocyclaceae bacterium]|nr:protein rep [Rhodocyclaceae bacterium]